MEHGTEVRTIIRGLEQNSDYSLRAKVIRIQPGIPKPETTPSA